MGLAQYGRFLFIGALVAIVTIACRELIAYVLGTDTLLSYSVSVVGAYGFGMALSFVLNGRFTFADSTGFEWPKFIRFTVIALLGMLATWMLSIGLRYGLRLPAVFGDASAGIAFAVAALVSSILTYPLNAMLVFRARAR
jgi:putative flippase GtrA